MTKAQMIILHVRSCNTWVKLTDLARAIKVTPQYVSRVCADHPKIVIHQFDVQYRGKSIPTNFAYWSDDNDR